MSLIMAFGGYLSLLVTIFCNSSIRTTPSVIKLVALIIFSISQNPADIQKKWI